MESYPEKISFGGESEEMPVLASQGIVERVSEESRNVKRGERDGRRRESKGAMAKPSMEPRGLTSGWF